MAMHVFSSMRLSLSHPPLFVLACRIVELFPAVPINPHWGIVSKCLAYSKAACDPFVYSLLRHQYKKTCTDILNRLLKRSSMNTSGRGHQTHGNSIPTAEWRTASGLTGCVPRVDLATVRETRSWFIADEEEDKLVVPVHVCLNLEWQAKKRNRKKEWLHTRANPRHRNTTVLAYWAARAADQCSELPVRRLHNGRLHIHLERQMCPPKKNGRFTFSFLYLESALGFCSVCLFWHYCSIHWYYVLKKKRVRKGCMSVLVCAKCLTCSCCM